MPETLTATEIPRKTVLDWVLDEYSDNDAVGAFSHTIDAKESVRVTHESNAHRVDIRVFDGVLTISGELHGEQVNASCEPTRKDLVDTLSRSIPP